MSGFEVQLLHLKSKPFSARSQALFESEKGGFGWCFRVHMAGEKNHHKTRCLLFFLCDENACEIAENFSCDSNACVVLLTLQTKLYFIY